MKKEIKEYNSKYGHLSSCETRDDLVEYIKTHTKINQDRYNAMKEHIEGLQWGEQRFIIGLEPKGSPRPRLNGKMGTIYVKGAKSLKKYLKEIIISEGIICTRTELILTTYQPTPLSSMSNTEILLAEEGLLRPISTPDFDNLAKTYTDAIVGHLLLNDNIVNPGIVDKYYSIKPRIEVVLRYQLGFDSLFNERKTKNTIAFKNAQTEGGNILC